LGSNPENMNLKGDNDLGKSVDGIDPKSWGSARVAHISTNGDLATIRRLATNDDI
jgi:hypothetical protein